MNYKCALLKLLVSLVVSPVIIYVVLIIARTAGADYSMSHGDTFIIWILMAILVSQCLPGSWSGDNKK